LADGPPAAVSAQLLTVLLDTVHNLYQALSGMNAGLEQQVGQRTAELRASNARLQAEQQALNQTLRELADTQAQLLLNQKMAAVGQLAAGIAHEVNNPVGFVRSNLVTLDEYSHNLLALVDGYRTLHLGLNLDAQQLNRLRLLEEEYELDYIRDDLPALFSESLQGVERVRKIVRQLLGYSRAEDEQLAELNLNQTLQELLSLLRAGLPENLQVDCQWGEVPMCLARTAEIGQIFSNIFFNAVQAVEQQALPRIVIATGYVDDDLWFAVSDNGCGMSAEQQSRVFEPFFSTRAQGQGNGLGMTVVWNLLARYQGRIAIDSSPQQGTCVRVCLPQRPA
jgi:C4-dicarboxylate-specific signal transduction histidine kinase